ncbi:MAG TPA: glutathione-disulfide reductase [Polyangiaceae bacterium]
MSDFDFDLFVIGAGSGGVRAARISAQHGAKVAVAEEYRVGGTCVIRGCVPKKLLVYGAHFAEDLRDARCFGWDVPDCNFDWKKLRDNVNAEVSRIEGLYAENLEKAGVTIVRERATIEGPNEVRLASGKKVRAKYILIATGAHPDVPAVPGCELGISSNEVFHLEEIPKRAVIIGAGYIANEFAGIFHELGAHVTLVNRTGDILRQYDQEIVERLIKISTAKGIDFKFHAQLERLERLENGSIVVRAHGIDPIEADLVLFATGRRPNTKGLGLENAGIALGKHDSVPVDDDARTSCPSIFAIGDVTDRVQLTPVAIREGHTFADRTFGKLDRHVDYGCIPSAVFSHPPIAAVGLTEAAAKKKYGSAKVYRSDFRAMKNVLAHRDERALYKMVCHPETDVVVGVHLIGPDSAEILQPAAIAVRAGLTKKDFDETVALHPTMAEELVLMR